MAFEGLSSKLSSALSKLTSRGKLTEQAVKEGMRDVRMALLEADVNYLVVKDFCKKVTERCVGQQVLDSLSPAQQVMKIVSEEMTALMGSEHARLTWSSSVPTIYMLCGLQGAGKTTMAGKLANYLQKQGKKPLLAACDIYRPAAIKQLQVVGSQVNVPVYEHGTQDPVKTAQEAIEQCRHYGRDVLIIDTAGRLQIDTALMEELRRIKAEIKPQEILFVVDAMTGQEAVNVAKTFDERSGHRRRDPDQAGRRHPRRRGPVHQGRHRQAHQVLRHGRKALRHRALLPRPHGQPHSGHGRHDDPHRKSAGGLR